MITGRSGTWIRRIQNAELALLILLMALCLGPQPFGITPRAVLSASMEPTVPVGSLVYIQEHTTPVALQKGEIIAFSQGNQLVLHRIVEIHEDSQTFTTQGDANAHVDSAPVSFETLEGVYAAHIPYLGFLLASIRENIGITVAVVIGFNAILVLAGQMASYTNRPLERRRHE